MPDGKGRLTEEERQKAEDWLRDKWTNWVCPFSGHNEWEIGAVLAQVTSFSGGNLIVGGAVYPALVVTCGGCGLTVLVSAIKAGIVAKKEDSDVK